jgi:RHS repeat-associated protein
LGTGDLSGGCQLITTNQYTYDPLGNILTHKDANQNNTTFNYTDSYIEAVSGPTYAYPTTVTKALSQKTLISYDYASGTPSSVTDPNNAVTTYSHNDPFYRFTGMTAADGGQTSVVYTPVKSTMNRDQVSPGDGAITTSTLYDGLGRVSETRTFEDGGGYISVQKSYDAMGRLALVTNPSRPGDGLGYATTYLYDALGRTTQVTSQDQSTTTTSYSGNQTTATDQASRSRTTTEDGLGRLTQVIEDTGSSPHLNYATTYAYDPLDNLLSVNQGTGSSARNRLFTYDSFKRLTKSNNPESGTINYTYDLVGNLLTKTDGRFETCYGTLSGPTCTTGYDALNRPTTKSFSDPNTSTVNWTYDNSATGANGIGRLWTVSNGYSTTTFSAYDRVGRITASGQTPRGASQPYPFSYSYNLAGALTTEHYPSGRKITTGYDAANRPASLSDATNNNSPKYYVGGSDLSSWIQYSPHGVAWNYTRGNGLTHTEDFNARLQPVQSYDSLQNTNTAQNMLLLLCPQWGTGGPLSQTVKICPTSPPDSNNGNLLGSLEFIGGPGNAPSPFLAGSPTFQLNSVSYDSLNRLTGISDSGGWSRNFAYDQWGNMAVSAASGTAPLNINTPQVGSQTPISSLYNSNNQLVIPGGGIGYDGAGNTNALNTFSGISYDAENRLTAETSNGTYTYQYDGNGRRVTKTGGGNTTTYTYDAAGQLAAEYDNTTPQPAQCTTCYLSSDHLGSVRLVTDSSGQVISRHDYLPFGEEIVGGYAGRTSALGFGTAEGVTQRFTGEERDSESGLDYFGARYYGSALGRFTSPDEALLDQNPSNPQSWNLYSYVRNKPLTSFDPSGNCSVKAGATGATDDQDSPCVAPGDNKTTVTASVDPPQLSFSGQMYLNFMGYVGVLPNEKRTQAEYQALQFETLQHQRQMIGLPAAGSKNDKSTLARLVINGKTYDGVNRKLQDPKTPMTMQSVNAITITHAEADVVQQAISDGQRGLGGTAELFVDRLPCGACGVKNGLGSLARELGVSQLVVHSPGGTQTFYPTSQ